MKYSSIKLVTADSAGVSGATLVYANKDALPAGSEYEGTLALSRDSDRLYLHTGQGWFNIGIVNTTPVWVTQPASEYELASDATAYKNGTQTDIILRARDSEGMSLTWSAVPDTAFNNMAHIAQDSTGTTVNKFTIEPKSEDSAPAGDIPNGSVTFKASDGVNILSAVSTFTLTFDYSITYSENTSMNIKASGNDGTNNTAPTDASGTGHTITMNNNVVQGTYTPYSPSAWSWYFDSGATEHVVFKERNSNDFDVGSGDYTVECWFYITDFVGAGGGIFHLDDAGTITDGGAAGLAFGYTNTGLVEGVGGNVVDTQTDYGSKKLLWEGNWYHIAMVKNGSTRKVYLDGVEILSKSVTGNPDISHAIIGCHRNTNNTGYHHEGYITDFRFVKGTAVYTAAFTPPTGPLTAISGTQLLTCNTPWIGGRNAAGRLDRDNSDANGFAFVSDEVSTHPISPWVQTNSWTASKHGGSAYFHGADSRIAALTDHSDFNFGTGNYTVEFWVNPFDGLGDNKYLFDARKDSGDNHPPPRIKMSSGCPRVYANASTVLFTSAIPLEKYCWTHLALVRNSGTTKLYQDGQEVGTSSTSYNWVAGSSPHSCPTLGNFNNNGGNSATSEAVQGFYSDWRISNTARYTSEFTPPIQQTTTDSNTKLHVKFTGAHVYDTACKMNYDFFSSATTDTGEQKFSTPSLDFRGTDDYICSPVSDYRYNMHLSPRNGDFTFQTWVNISTMAGNGTIFASRTSDGDAGGWALLKNSSGGLHVYRGGGNAQGPSTSSNMSANTWYHIAITRKDRNTWLWKNGVRLTGGADAGWATDKFDLKPTGSTVYYNKIGHSGFGDMDGWLSRPKMSLDARYPFTPKKRAITTTENWGSGVSVTASNCMAIACHSSTLTANGGNSGTAFTVVGDPTAYTGRYNINGGMHAVHFDGNDYLTSTDSDYAVGSGEFTLECWFRKDAPSAGGTNQGLFEISPNATLGGAHTSGISYMIQKVKVILKEDHAFINKKILLF